MSSRLVTREPSSKTSHSHTHPEPHPHPTKPANAPSSAGSAHATSFPFPTLRYLATSRLCLPAHLRARSHPSINHITNRRAPKSSTSTSTSHRRARARQTSSASAQPGAELAADPRLAARVSHARCVSVCGFPPAIPAGAAGQNRGRREGCCCGREDVPCRAGLGLAGRCLPTYLATTLPGLALARRIGERGCVSQGRGGEGRVFEIGGVGWGDWAVCWVGLARIG